MSTPNPRRRVDSSADNPQQSSADGNDILLYCATYNPAGKTTVLLIHGAFTSGVNWDLTVPSFSNAYRLLVPDLPGHGQSCHLKPFSVEYSSRLLAQLIRKRANNQAAHVIGHSLGAHVAVNLASSYPDLVDAVFVSGFEIFPRSALSPCLPYVVWVTQRIENLIPRRVIKRLMDGADLPRTDTAFCTLDLIRQIVSQMTSTTWPSPWPARTVIVAAGKGGIVPSNDHPQDAIKLAEIGKILNPETVALTHLAMRHPWHRQDPRLFEEMARAWFEREDFPNGFMKL